MSPLLLNGMALAKIHLAKYEEAESLLQESLQKSASHPDTLVNMIVCMHHMQKPADQIQRFQSQLRAVAPTHPWLVRMDELEASFDRLAAEFDLTKK
jgi:uncharacterized protein HemY